MITGAQIRAARRLLSWQHRVLANRSRLDLATVARVERLDGELPTELASAANAMRLVLEAAHIKFLDDGGVSAPARAEPTITPAQIKEARKLLGWSAATLAKRSRKSLLSIAQAEQGTLPPRSAENVLRGIQSALEGVGIELKDEAPGVRLRTSPAA